ncbi:MAG: glycosyltransferase, partial [Candidatus Paceibacterales bacterium]
MQTPIDISIVTYNSARWLNTFFNSLCNQRYPLQQLNLFIHDNSSTDGTYVECQKLQKSLNHRFASFTLTQEPNKGFGYGHNQNFHKGNAPFFLVTNVDLEFEPDALIEMIKMVNNELDEKVASFEFRQKPYEHPKYYHPVTLETPWSSSACVLFRRSAFKAINGYEEKIFLYGEDVEISYRLRDHGYSLKYCPRAVCWHYTYNNPRELKPLQYFGSKTANIYIRLRYGNILEIINGFIFYLVLFFIPARIDHRISTLFKNFFAILKNTPY